MNLFQFCVPSFTSLMSISFLFTSFFSTFFPLYIPFPPTPFHSQQLNSVHFSLSIHLCFFLFQLLLLLPSQTLEPLMQITTTALKFRTLCNLTLNIWVTQPVYVLYSTNALTSHSFFFQIFLLFFSSSRKLINPINLLISVSFSLLYVKIYHSYSIIL